MGFLVFYLLCVFSGCISVAVVVKMWGSLAAFFGAKMGACGETWLLGGTAEIWEVKLVLVTHLVMEMI